MGPLPRPRPPWARPAPCRRTLGVSRTCRLAATLLQGVDLDQLLDMSTDELVELFPARQRRRWAYM